LVLAGTFAVLTFAGSSGSGGSQIRDIGAGLGAGILMDTFLVRTLLVPSTVAILGRWNWWPQRVEAGMGYPGARRETEGTPPAANDVAVAVADDLAGVVEQPAEPERLRPERLS
jgi:uncharacterized membrane protein YdfJ with MMPL/SSD domain